MFYITAETCRTFTLVEILIMAAMNMETTRQASSRVQPKFQRSTQHARPYTCYRFQESAAAA